MKTEIWEWAWRYFNDARLIECGDGLHPTNELCANCYKKTSRSSRKVELKK